MARIGTAYVDIEGNFDPLFRQIKAAIPKVKAELDALSRETISPNVEIDDKKALAELARLASKDVTVGGSVDMDTGRATEKIDKLGSDDVTVHGSVDLDIGAAEAKIELLKRQASGIGGGIGGGLGSSGSSGGGFLSNIFSGGLTSPAVIGSGLTLAPTVGASLLQGTLGAGALGVAGGAAAGVGGAGIFAVAKSGLTDLSTALKAYDTQQQSAGADAVQMAQQQFQAATQQKAAAEAVQVAQENLSRARVSGDQAVAGAEEQLKNAQAAETVAQKALTQARSDAVRQLQDMRRAATESVTAEQQARLNLEQARRALATAPGSTTALDLRQLELSVTEARQALTDSHISRKRANQDANQAERQGVKHMPGVVAARGQLTAANQAASDAATTLAQTETQAAQAIKDAQRGVSDALTAQSNAAKQASLQARALAISQDKLGVAMQDLPASGQAVVHTLIDLQNRWEELSKPAQNDFFGLLNDGVTEANKLMPMFAHSADSSIGAVRSAFDKFLSRLNSPGFHDFIHTMTVTFAKGIGPVVQSFTNLGVVLGRIAIAAAPALIRMLKSFREMTRDWVVSTKNAHGLRVAVNGVVNQFKDWLRLIGAVGNVLGELFLANTRGADAGGNAIKKLTHTLNGWADWIAHHHHEVNGFFINVLHTVEILGKALGNLAKSISPISDAFVPISNAILKITTALNSLKVGNVSALTVLLGALTGKAVLGKLGLLGAAGGAASGAGGLLAGGASALGEAGISTGLADAAGGSVVAGGAAAALLPAAAGVGIFGAFASKGGIPDTISGNAVDTSIHLELLQKAMTSVIDHYGSLNKAAKHMSLTQKSAFLGLVQDAHNAGQITDGVFNKLMLTITGTNQVTTHSIKKWASDTVASFANVIAQNKKLTSTSQDTRDKVSAAAAQQTQNVLQSYSNLDKGVGTGLNSIQDNTNKALKALGLNKPVQFRTNEAPIGGGGVGHRAGAALGGFLPGYSKTDNIPLMARGGEAILRPEDHVPLVSRALRSTYGFGLQEMFKRTGAKVQHFAKGGNVMGAMVNEVNKFESQHFPYSWGGGHSHFGIEPVDCSGFVSDVLHAGGLLNTPMVSGSLMNWGKPGKGPLTVYANPDHTFMSLDGKFAGTSGSNPGGGAGWVEGGYPASYLSGFVARTMDAAGKAMFGGAQKLARILLLGPKGPPRDTGQAALDRAWKGASQYVASKVPSGSLGGGQAPKDLPGSLRQYDHLWAPHQSPDYSGPTMPFNKIAELAEWAGHGRVPGVTMAQVTKGESGSRPGAWGIDPGGTRGYGLWAITTGVGNDAMINALGGSKAMLNPIVNAEAMAKIYGSSGLGAWFGTGSVTSPSAHYTGKMAQKGGMVPWYGGGADFIANRPQLIGVGDGGPERVRVGPPNGDDVHVHNHIHLDDPSLRDLIRVESSVEYDERAGLSRQEARMR